MLMVKKYRWLGRILVVTGTLMMLTACGKDTNDAQIPVVGNIEFPSYVEKRYRSEKLGCVDLNLNGVCDSGEDFETNLTNNNNPTTTSPVVKNYDDLLLTAVANSKIITPFTTLINNEVMFNPLVNGDVTLAKAYLTSKFNFNFSQLDLIDGPEKEANEIIDSLLKSNKLLSNNPYLNIAAAVDLMVYAGNFVVEPLQVHVDKLKHPQLIVRDSFTLNSTGRVKVSKFDLHPITGRMIIIADDNTRLALNANTGAYSVIKTDSIPAQTSVTTAHYNAQKPQRDDDDHDKDDHDKDDHDKDDDDKDDDDHDYSWYEAYLKWLEGKQGTKFDDVSIVKQSIATNKFYLLSASVGNRSTDTCEATGSQGLFLMAMTQKVADVSVTKVSAQRVSTISNFVKADAFSAATNTDVDIFTPKPDTTTGTTLPDPIPDIDNSEASCYSKAFKSMAITDDSTVIAVVARGLSNESIHRLSGDTLSEQLSPGYVLPSGINLGDVAISNDGQYIAFTDLSSGAISLVNFNTMKLVAKYNASSYQLTKLHFISDHQLVAIGQGSNDAGSDNQVLLIDYDMSRLTLSQTVALTHKVNKLTVNKNSLLVAVANGQDISLLKIENNKLVLQTTYLDASTDINQIGLLSDKVIFSANAVIHYISLEGIFGSELRAAQRYLTKGLITRARQINNNASLVLPRTFTSLGLNSVNIEWRTNNPEQLDVITGRLTRYITTDLTVTATISGLFRGEIHRVEKSYQIN